MKKYKALFLDWDDTIGDFGNAAQCSLRDMYAEHGLAAYFESFDQYMTIYSKHNTRLWEQYGLDEVTKEYLEFDRFFFPLMMAPRPLSAFQAAELAQKMAKEHLQHTTTYFRLLPDAENVVRKLAEKYPLTIVSNGFVEVQYKKIALSGLSDCFTHVVLSEEVGCQKPNPRIFEIALEKNGLNAEDVLMIGDSWTSDMQGAQNAGIDQMWINENADENENRRATYKVSCLKEILPLLM